MVKGGSGAGRGRLHRPPMAQELASGVAGYGGKLGGAGGQSQGGGRSGRGGNDGAGARGIDGADDLGGEVRMARVGDVDLEDVVARHGHAGDLGPDADIDVGRGAEGHVGPGWLADDAPLAPAFKVAVRDVGDADL